MAYITLEKNSMLSVNLKSSASSCVHLICMSVWYPRACADNYLWMLSKFGMSHSTTSIHISDNYTE